MSLTNQSKPTTTLVNSNRPSGAELWNTITTTWASETRTWADCISLFDGFTKPTTTITNVSKPI